MAKNGPQRNTVATIRDRKGNMILEVTQKEYVVKESDGPLTAYSEYDNIILEDGLAWTPSMLGQKPPIRIAVCDICRRKRKPKTHGLVSVTGARLCVCGKLCCPKHRRQSSRDHKWRCPTCHGGSQRWQLFCSCSPPSLSCAWWRDCSARRHWSLDNPFRCSVS